MPNLFFKGRVPHAEVPAALAGCDVVLAPYAKRVEIADGQTDVSRWMSPLKIFEYMAQGHAIMASDLPVIREVLEDGVSAALCPPDAPEAWARRLDALLTDPAARRRLGDHARDLLETRYTWQRRARYILDKITAD
ncbi:MAG: glycosyltransferase [Pseudomonadota bacterium]|nr:glycosyltransferase [Pseudomonadota bacterium]